MEERRLKEAIASLERLPALPAAAARAVSMLASGEVEATEIERVFRGDEGLTTATLRRANSAALGGGARRTFGLREAITRLGHRALLRIALEHSAAAPLRDAGKCFGLHRDELWKSSLGGGGIAEQLARDTGMADPDICFCAGLLRDIGKLALDELAGNERAIGWIGAAEETPFSEIERARFGADHAQLGAMLAERWRLPESIVKAIRHHHEPDQVDDRVVDVTHCADCVARWAGLGIGDDGLMHPMSQRARVLLTLDRTRVESLAALAHDVIASFAESLGGDLRKSA
jgi:putative nucleotidyltransferase with HDIG domain